jgi:hypothetical protein
MKKDLIIYKMKNKFNLTKKEEEIIRKLNTPAKIQDFLSAMPANFEDDGNGETCLSPRKVLEKNKCHCIEGAFFAAACIWINKIGVGKPLVIDMIGEKGDWDHVIAVFKINNRFGAISKTNHSVLRYRDAVYSNVRELVMSYFNEYSDDKGFGKKTLRKYSDAIDLSSFGKDWITSEEDLWHIHDYIDSVKHFNILTKEQIKELRKQEQIEIDAGQMTQFSRPKL